ncbi:hypothetical protein [Streptosporangium sp. NPDC051022]|uniref:trypsin-like serine peptidase n=1 Tax=Streptosporangium sp. NPDC051022 TaxID=3155752 RepID=UPI00341E10D7
MTSSLPLLGGAALAAGLMGVSLTGAAITGHRQRAASDPVQAVQAVRAAQMARPAVGVVEEPPDATGVTGGSGGNDGNGDRVPVRRRADVVEHLAARATAEQRRVLDYWTPRRMADAVPIGLLGTVTGTLGTASHALHPLRGTAGAAAPGTPNRPGIPNRPAAPGAPNGPGEAGAADGRGGAGAPDGPGGAGAPDGPGGPGAGGSAPLLRERTGTAAPGPLTTVTGMLTGAPVPALSRQARVGGARWAAGGWVSHTTGRVFLTLDGVDFVCSASSVRSANRDLVVTAGHCLKDGAGAWADNWTFVPGYDRGRQPYGQFTARRMFVTGPWAREGDDSYDIGMVALNPRGGRHLGEVVGAQDIAFGSARGRQTHGFGFPADAPYDGERLVYCAGPVRDDPHGQTGDQGLRCDMTAGSSGGPWMSGFDPVTGRGTVTSVSSFKYSDDRGTMYGPYFGEIARQLYATSEKS